MEADEADIRAFRTGAPAGFEALFLRHRDRIFAQAFRRLRDEGLALDVVQESFLALLQVLPGWEFRAPVGAWLSETAWRLCQTQRRRRLPGGDADREAPAPDGPPGDPERLWREVDALPPRERQAVLLRYGQGLSPAESAREMGITEKAVSSHLSRALGILRQKNRPPV